MLERDGLLRREADAWAALLAAAEGIPESRLTTPGVVPGWSAADLVFHCGKWAEVAATHLEEIIAGTFVDEDLPDDVTQAMNDAWADQSKSLTWQESVTAAEAARGRARAALQAIDEVDEAASTWFADETYDHYLEHTEHILRFAAGSM